MLNLIAVLALVYGVSFLIGKTNKKKDPVSFAMNWTLVLFLGVVALVVIMVLFNA